jgi:CheY-like chemotaxis protein
MRAELDPSAAAWQPAPDILADMPLRALDDFSRDYPHRILVVEGNRVNRRKLCQFLANLGYQADEAEDGQMAVAAAMSGEYDMIFMDLHTPNMNGIEATRWIRQHGHGDRAPRIIALTGDAALETREQCFAAGMDEFITKPIRPERLEAILRFETAQAA